MPLTQSPSELAAWLRLSLEPNIGSATACTLLGALGLPEQIYAQRATAFTPEQTEWLRLMKDHIASSCSIARDDFDYAEFASRGGLQKAWTVLGKELDTLMTEMNEELVA